MGLNFFQRRKILKNANVMDLHPIRNHEHEFKEDGNIYLIVPKFRKKWMRDFFIAGTKKKNFTIYLDELGTSTWLEIDGKKSVQELCDKMQKKFPEKLSPEDEAINRITKFLFQLYEQRYITFQELLTKEDYSN
jgi:hypothetical protein